MSFSERLKMARNEKGWTQCRLANAAGLSGQAIDQIERGLRTPSAETLRKLALALGKSADWFLGIEQPKAAPPQFSDIELATLDWSTSVVKCASCSYNYISIISVERTIPKSGVGRSWVGISFICEWCGLVSILGLQDHKGQVCLNVSFHAPIPVQAEAGGDAS
ncbi:MAG: helix-turn-helix transcriptional regulator [Phaeospirillum sp.]|nr:helix-turn-helix transcriptional regulator [Phaeospirillum sp.]